MVNSTIGERLFLVSFDEDGSESFALGDAFHFVEQDGLANSPQSRQ